MEKDKNIKDVLIFVYQEFKDSLCERNLIYCDILEPENKTLAFLEPRKEHDEIVNGIFRRVFDAILTVVELQDIGLMEWDSTSILEHYILKDYTYVLITFQCRSVTYNCVECLQKALHTFNPARFIDLDEVGHLMEGQKRRRKLYTKSVASDLYGKEVMVSPPLDYKISSYADLMTNSVRGHYECPWEEYKPPRPYHLFMWLPKSYQSIPDEMILRKTLPIKKIDLRNDPPVGKTRVTWIGHATLLVEFDGITVLTDPVFGSHAAPLQLFMMPYKRYRPAACQVADIPRLDAVIISNDHYDHLDAEAVKVIHTLFPDVLWFVAMGTKEWLVVQGCNLDNITELEWWQEATCGDIRFVCLPSQHWCQRSPDDSRLWCSWLIKGPTQTFYFAGDTGYFKPLFKAIGDRYKKIHLAAIPIGAYKPRSKIRFQRRDPEEAVSIHEDIQSYMSIGISWGAFPLTNEHYLEPPHRLKKAMEDRVLDPNKFVCLNIGETWIVGDPRKEPQFMEENVRFTYE